MKSYLLIFTAILILSASCVHISGYDEYQAAKNHELIKDLFKAFNNHDFKLMASYYADTAKFLDPSLGKNAVKQSHLQTEAKYTEMAKTLAGLKDSTTNITANGDQVAVQFISTWKTKDSTSLSLPVCTVFKLKNGKIISDATYYDRKE